MSWWLFPYNPFTEGGKLLARALGGKRIKKEGGRFRPTKLRKIINWGNKEIPRAYLTAGKLINQPDKVAACIDKGEFFRAIQRAQRTEKLIPFTFDREQALRWGREGHHVVSRTILNGHSGAGIIITSPRKIQDLPNAPLYTKYIPKDEEYRVHVVRDARRVPVRVDAHYVQKKVKRADFEEKHNRRVRSHANGYTYQHNNITVPRVVTDAALEVFQASGLDFGGVDVIFCREQNAAFVLEINTAPGLEGASVDAYASALKKYF